MNKSLQHAATIDEMIVWLQSAKNELGGSAKIVVETPFSYVTGGVSSADFCISRISKTGEPRTVTRGEFKCVKIGCKS